jgi:cytochrome c-type biogenesis protein CcmH
MMLGLVFALMTAAAAFAVLWPLVRGVTGWASGSDLAVYQDQLAEIERDRAADRIEEREAEAARVEVSRRLLAAADKVSAEKTQSPTEAKWRRRAAMLAAATVLPLGALGLYLLLGSPGLPGEPLAARLKEPLEQSSIATLITRVEAHLARSPEDGRGWQVLGPAYMQLGRFDEAVTARRNSLRLLGATASRQADLGEALVAAANGVITSEAKDSFERALALDGHDVRARFYVGLAAEQDGRREEAAAMWRDLVATAPAGAPWIDFVQRSLAELEGTPAPQARSAPGPNESEIAAAAKLAPDERNDMVRSMVERLADRLQRDGSDVEGWLRLVRAYTVLGERDKARAAASDARRALAADPDKLRRLDELVKGLGLEG